MGFKKRERELQIQRVYDKKFLPGPRFLVDRVWPRGLRREALRLEAWLPDVGPSTQLRTWFAHEIERWPEFVRRYEIELEAAPQHWAPLAAAQRAGPITLLYSARDPEHNQAVALREFLLRRG